MICGFGVNHGSAEGFERRYAAAAALLRRRRAEIADEVAVQRGEQERAEYAAVGVGFADEAFLQDLLDDEPLHDVLGVFGLQTFTADQVADHRRGVLLQQLVERRGADDGAFVVGLADEGPDRGREVLAAHAGLTPNG